MPVVLAISLLLLLVSSTSDLRAADGKSLDEPACRQAFEALGRPSVLRAEFSQEKTLPEVARTLRASGELVVSSEHGVILRTLAPEFAKGTKVLPSHGRPAGSNPVEIRVNGMIKAVLAGEFDPLLTYFTAQGRRQDGRTIVTLTPKVAEIRGALTSIEIHFGERLEQVLVQEAGGGSLRLTFKGYRTTPPLTEAEALSLTASGR